MVKPSYIVTLRIPIEARDDIEAREETVRVSDLLMVYLNSPSDVTVKLQEIFENKPPRSIELPKGENK